MTSPKPLRIVVAINPTASFGRGSEVGPAVVATLRAVGHEVTSLTEPDFAQLVEAAQKALATKPDALVVVGGDGMVSLGVNLVAQTRIPLGIVPSGTGNDTARGLGIPVGNAEAAIDALVEALRQPPRVIDAGRVHHTDKETGERHSTWFAGVLSAGFDAIVNERANGMSRPKGASRYLLALAIELARLRPISYRISFDGVDNSTRGMLVSVANGNSIGGGMRVAPDAAFDDGLFDVLVVTPLSRIAFLRIFPRVFKGTHLSDPRATITQARRVTLEAEGVVAYADGERVGPLPVEIEVIPGVLRVLAGAPPKARAEA